LPPCQLKFIESSVEQRAVTKADLQQPFSSLREQIRQGDPSLREEIHALGTEIHKIRADLIKWSFGSWVTAVAALSGIMLALLRGAR